MKAPAVLGIVTYKVFPALMGGQKCVADFYTHLAKSTRVVMAVYKDNEIPPENPLQAEAFLYHHKWGFANLRYVYRLYKIIKQRQIDIISIEHSYPGWMGILLRWLTKKPFIIHAHNIETHRFRDMQKPWWRLYAWYEKWVHKQADHNFFITSEDQTWALEQWQLAPEKCTVITYGTDITHPEGIAVKNHCRQQLIRENQLPANTRLFLFNGSFDYLPNTDALRVIMRELIPILKQQSPDFRILVCGRWLNESWQKVLQTCPEIIYKGMVSDIDLYYKGADCFINPVTLGSGIKIKLIHALAHNLTVVSVKNGARGVAAEKLNGKLIVVADYDWRGFAREMVSPGTFNPIDTPEEFYTDFNWDAIIQKALLSLQSV